MNENHATLCPSPEWAAHIQTEVLPALVSEIRLGQDMLEIGPGPGAATEWLRHKVTHLSALEVDPAAAGTLAARYAGTNVEVTVGDATAMDFADASFDSVGTFTMLHHVPTAAQQGRVLAEALRVLRPGGVLIGSDSYNPVEPASMLLRLQILGFHKITIFVDEGLKFIAHKPSPEPDGQDQPC